MTSPISRAALIALLAALPLAPLSAQRADSTPSCTRCAEWNAPQKPFRIYGNTYYVGTHGLGSVLITSPNGHVLIDGALAESPPSILANIRALGFRIEDVKLILNSHVHYDHAGGIAALQRASGATVAASPSSAKVLESGEAGRDDPQYGIALRIAPVRSVRVIADGETLRVGPIAITAHFTPGHTPGGTSWTWRSCDGTRCMNMVYADSQTPVSADDFRYTTSATYPTGLADFAKSAAVLDSLPCDILVTPHPEASGLFDRIARRDQGDESALVNPQACRQYAAHAREQVAKRVASERAKP